MMAFIFIELVGNRREGKVKVYELLHFVTSVSTFVLFGILLY